MMMMMMFYAQLATKGHIKAKLNVLLPQLKYCSFFFFLHSSLFMIGEIVGGGGEYMKFNESGRQKLWRYTSCQQAQHAKLYSDLLQA